MCVCSVRPCVYNIGVVLLLFGDIIFAAGGFLLCDIIFAAGGLLLCDIIFAAGGLLLCDIIFGAGFSYVI